MWTVDAARFAVVGGLAVAVVVGEAGIALLAAVGFLLGTGQTLVDTGAHSILPALVSRDPQRLERANGRRIGAQVVTQELAGRPPAGSCSRWRPGRDPPDHPALPARDQRRHRRRGPRRGRASP
jgi:hypothetical protein